MSKVLRSESSKTRVKIYVVVVRSAKMVGYLGRVDEKEVAELLMGLGMS